MYSLFCIASPIMLFFTNKLNILKEAKMSEKELYQKDYNQEAYYDDINYEAILNADYGYRTEETIAQSAKDIAKEHQLDEIQVKKELDRINQKQKEQENSLESHLHSLENALENTPEKSLGNANHLENQPTNQAENQIDNLRNLDNLKSIGESLNIENPKIEESLQVAMALRETQKNLQEAKEEVKNRGIENNLSPKDKLDIADNTIKEFNSNRPLVKETIETDLNIKVYSQDVDELLLEKERRKQSPNQEIPNQPKDIAELLQQLYKMDKALAELIGTHQDLKLAESERKMREFEELLQRDKIQALTQIVSDISDKYIQLQGEKANILDSKKEYEALNQLMDKNEKPEIIKDKMEKINQKFPNFSKDYPITTKRANEYAKGNAPQQQTQQQNQSQGRNL